MFTSELEYRYQKLEKIISNQSKSNILTLYLQPMTIIILHFFKL
jgi:hypothetical protein